MAGNAEEILKSIADVKAIMQDENKTLGARVAQAEGTAQKGLNEIQEFLDAMPRGVAIGHHLRLFRLVEIGIAEGDGAGVDRFGGHFGHHRHDGARIHSPGEKGSQRHLGEHANTHGFAQAPDRKRAYGIKSDIGRYEFWTFDLEKATVISRQEFKGRPRVVPRVSSNGKGIYVYIAGDTIDLYDAATYRYLRTIHLGADQTTEQFVVPPAAASSAR